MTTLVLKLVLTPLLIGGATLAGRRWGGAVSGWLVGLPLTSGPVSAFLAAEHGRTFAAHAAVGSLAGVVGEIAFFLAWRAVVRRGTAAGVALGSVAFAAVAAAIQALQPSARAPWPLLPLVAAAVAALVVGLKLLPEPPRAQAPPPPPPRWDLPVRAVAATALVLVLTGLAATLGARLTGVIAVYPLYSIVLAAFARRTLGADGTVRVLRGVVLGLFAFTGFFLVLALVLPRVHAVPAYAAAIAAALVVQSASFGWLRSGACPSAPSSSTSTG